MSTEDDDSLRAEPARAITPHRPTAPSPTTAAIFPEHLRSAGCVMAGAHHIGESEERRHELVVRPHRKLDQRCQSASGNANSFSWPAVQTSCLPPESRMQTGRLQTLPTKLAGAVDHANGATTRSPFFTVRTSARDVLDSADETHGPLRFAVSALGAIELYGHRSLPQMQARVTVTNASV
jgi:hypothetical protein